MTNAAVGGQKTFLSVNSVRALAPGEMEGVFGPDLLPDIWRIDREALTFLCPAAPSCPATGFTCVGQAAIAANTRRPLTTQIGRFHRTFAVVFNDGVFGTALSAARGLHRRHAAIHGRLPITIGPFHAGSPYQANDLAALRWLHANPDRDRADEQRTTSFFHPLTREERARYQY